MIKDDIKILVIDDMQDNLTRLNSLIKMSFPEAIILNALNGEKGIALARDENPDVILLDIIMPTMDGYEVCANLKKSYPINTIPVVFVSAFDSSKESFDRSTKCGADGFLAKPVNSIELKTQIKAMVKVKIANVKSHMIQQELDELVAQRTAELNRIHLSTLNILEDLQRENKSRAKSEELNKSITQTAADAIISINGEGKVLSWNNAAEKIFGYSSKEMLNNKINLLLPKSHIHDYKTGLKRLEEGGVPRLLGEKVELSATRKGGQEFPIELSLSKWTSENEQYYTGIVRDITIRKRSQQIQRVIRKISNATLSSVNLENLHAIIKKNLSTIIDTRNYYIAIYDEVSDMISLQYFVDEHDNINSFPTGKTLTAYVIKTKKSLLANQKKQQQLAAEGKITIMGTPSKVWLGVPLKTADKTIGVLAVQSYEKEDAFDHEDKEILEIIADQISISINRKKSEENLQQALINATESDRLKSAFLATMSHELRTPLNAVIGFSELLTDEHFPKEVTDFAKIISLSGNNLLNIIEDIFDITLIESGKTVVRKSKANLHLSLNNIHKLALSEQENLTKTQLELNIHLPEEHHGLTINTDFSKLKHILMSLIKNALKFTESGQVNYGYTFIEDAHRPMIRFYVEDTGIGIPTASSEIIYSTFRQADDTFTRQHGGTGVGLSISKRLVKLLGGEIWHTSAQGKGSIFFFTIPLHISDLVDDTKKLSKTMFPSKLALIVEDDDCSYEFLRILLENHGVKTLHATNGIIAVGHCKKYPGIDVVFMDINMPLMNGLEATREIRKFNKDVIIIAQTAFAFESNKKDAIDSGCNDYIAKPVDNQKLINMLSKYVN